MSKLAFWNNDLGVLYMILISGIFLSLRFKLNTSNRAHGEGQGLCPSKGNSTHLQPGQDTIADTKWAPFCPCQILMLHRFSLYFVNKH